MPYSVFTVFNQTTIGRNGTGGKGINWKDNAGGKVFNSVLANASKMRLESGSASAATATADGTTSVNRFLYTRTSGGEFNEYNVGTAAAEPDAMIKYTTFQGSAASSVLGYFTGTSSALDTILSNDTSLSYTSTSPLNNMAPADGTLDPRLARVVS